jgi:RNA polymerase sigma-70 factor (ECF subfamily)
MQSHSFEEVVSQYYESLYKFAMSLTGAEADACDLTQQTFYVWATKGQQLRDGSKVKSWLFTTLYREFLRGRRRASRFQQVELGDDHEEELAISPEIVNQLDAVQVVDYLGQMPELYRAAVSLFYLEQHSYKEIAEILDVPLGTVRSRISRGLALLHKMIVSHEGEGAAKSIPHGPN